MPSTPSVENGANFGLRAVLNLSVPYCFTSQRCVTYPNTNGKKTITRICTNTSASGMSITVPIKAFRYSGASSDPRMRPKTVMRMAAGTLPLANPVQEMVMPEVGNNEVSNNPRRINGCSEKNTSPSE